MSAPISPRAFWLSVALVLSLLAGVALAAGYRFGELVFLALIFSPGLGLVFAFCYGCLLLARKAFRRKEDV